MHIKQKILTFWTKYHRYSEKPLFHINGLTFGLNRIQTMKAIKKFQKQTFFIGLLTTNLVFMIFMTKQPLVHEEGRPRGRLSGRKCGDVDDYLSDHGNMESKIGGTAQKCIKTTVLRHIFVHMVFVASDFEVIYHISISY